MRRLACSRHCCVGDRFRLLCVVGDWRRMTVMSFMIWSLCGSTMIGIGKPPGKHY